MKKVWFIIHKSEGKDPYEIISVPEKDKEAFLQLYRERVFIEAESLQDAILRFAKLVE